MPVKRTYTIRLVNGLVYVLKDGKVIAECINAQEAQAIVAGLALLETARKLLRKAS